MAPFYSPIGRPSIDPELMVQMLLIGYLHGVRSQQRVR
jgi:transposase